MENTDKEFIMTHCLDHRKGYPFVFTKDYGLDVVVPNHPEYKVKPPLNYTVRVIITSFRGISFNAIHYYGRIIANGPYLSMVEDDGCEYSVGGFICKEWAEMSPADKKFINDSYEIEIIRPLTQKEIDEDPDRWHGYYAGAKTNGFSSIEEVCFIAKQIIDARFPGWETKIDDLT